MTHQAMETIKREENVGNPFKIQIWEDRTKGHRWVPTYDTGSLRLISDEYERTRNIRVSDIGMRYFEFVPMAPGTVRIEFESRYGWKFSADNHLIYEISISE